MNERPTLLSLKEELNYLTLLVPIKVSSGFPSPQIHLTSFSGEATIWEMDVRGSVTSCQHQTNVHWYKGAAAAARTAVLTRLP